jgi:hypothetical protein
MSDEVFVLRVEKGDCASNWEEYVRGVFTTLDGARQAVVDMAAFAAQQDRLLEEWNVRRKAYLATCTPTWVGPAPSWSKSKEPSKDYRLEDNKAAEAAAGPKPETVDACEGYTIYRVKLNTPTWNLEEADYGSVEKP